MVDSFQTAGRMRRLWRRTGPSAKRRIRGNAARRSRSRPEPSWRPWPLTVCCACSTGLPLPKPFCRTIKVYCDVWGIGLPERAARRMGIRRAGGLAEGWDGAGGWGRSAGIFFAPRLGAFLVVLVSLTAVIWITQALRDIDLMTSQGQTILVFIGITSLIIPLLVMMIAPIALVVAVAHILNKLATDSEIIVMNARRHVARGGCSAPFMAVTRRRLDHAGPAISAYVAPREPARCCATGSPKCAPTSSATSCSPAASPRSSSGLTFHIRERRPNGLLVGIFIDDRRDPDGARHHPRRARRDREERQRHLPAARRTAACSGTRPSSAIPASSSSTAMRSICRSSPAARRSSNIPCASAISGS